MRGLGWEVRGRINLPAIQGKQHSEAVLSAIDDLVNF
jgi:hypothetical protein